MSCKIAGIAGIPHVADFQFATADRPFAIQELYVQNKNWADLRSRPSQRIHAEPTCASMPTLLAREITRMSTGSDFADDANPNGSTT